ncbi:MAG: hypothetical protein E7474_03410 [Ruminococcaceae bacterium]|nr:hypothetical protein [Oscillospiraceae bacterium]
MLKRSDAGQPLWLPDVRDAFRMSDGVPLVLRLSSFDGETRDFRHVLPRWESPAERALVRDYLCASIHNMLSACGGYELVIFIDPEETEAAKLLDELPALFQLAERKRSGLGKVVSIADRMGRAFGRGAFRFERTDIRYYAPVRRISREAAPVAERLRALCAEAEHLNIVGVDVGGTDIKLTAAARGRLVAVKEYDWNPAAFSTVDQIIEPILLLTRLMRACIASDGADEGLARALRRDVPDAEIAAAVAGAEKRFDTGVLDAVGVSFPDIVLGDCIVGGETPKTDGVRRNGSVDYEAEFARLGALRDVLLPLCRGKGRCRIVNDGNMAAFTAAAELACGGAPELIGRGVVAHSLGTDLGTGWLMEDGTIPQMPLELYDLLLDLGAGPASRFPAEDLRSTRNENSGLADARRYLGQSAAYRLAWRFDHSLLDGFTEERDGVLRIRTEPDDLRKPCLEHLMRRAEDGDDAAEEVFRQIGRSFAVVSREMRYLLAPETDTRFLFGRFVKSERCFTLLREGCAESMPSLRLENGGDGLAETPLMRQLASRRDVTVAQFAQAVGALYYALT